MKSSLPLEALIIEPKDSTKIDASVIWLHGLGADGYDFQDLASQLRLPQDLHVRFILPHAPLRPVTINQGLSMPAWYDIFELTRMAQEDEQGIKASQAAIETLIRQEIGMGIPAERIFLGGFSQGGAMALYTGLRLELALAGIIGLSTYLPMANHLQHEKHPATQKTPIWLAHGLYDDIVSIDFGQKSKAFLEANSYHVQWHTYPMAHELCFQEIADLRVWLLSKLP